MIGAEGGEAICDLGARTPRLVLVPGLLPLHESAAQARRACDPSANPAV